MKHLALASAGLLAVTAATWDVAFAQFGPPMGGPPERYDAFMRAEQARWSDVVRKNNIRMD